jgi:pilus assembly protein CpaB
VRTPMAKRTKVTLLIGFLVFVAGSAGAAYLGNRNGAGGDGGASGGKVTVLYAAQAVNGGTAASTALADGLLGTKTVAASSVPASAITDPSQLSGRVAGRTIPSGTIVTTDMFAAPQTRIGTVLIPAGKRALALDLEPVSGVAGFVGAGDRVDVYSVAKNGGTPGVRLILQGVEVLNVNGAGLPTAQGQPTGPNLVYLLAVTPAEAERLIYLTEFEKLYFDLVPAEEAPVSTPGAGPTQALQAL